MEGKYRGVVSLSGAWLVREWRRFGLKNLINWTPLSNPEEGCTAIIGMCSRLPHVLTANLRCLYAARWPALRRVVITVDATERNFPFDLKILQDQYPEWELQVLHYSERQSAVAEKLKLPYVYSWMSWCIALAAVRTRHVLIHDYDALVLGECLARRYREFASSPAKIQGIQWYQVNGLEGEEDRLATTFEAFVDASWVRSLQPIDIFNKIGVKNGRTVDYDTLLHAQDSLLSPEQRTCVPMELGELVHPSQMIHQYTMFRRHPGKPLPCFSMPMLPFFSYLSGNRNALADAAKSLESDPRDAIDLAGNGTPMNLTTLELPTVDWVLKQMVQAASSLGITPDPELFRYGQALYKHVNAPKEAWWKGDFDVAHRLWIDRARLSLVGVA